MQLNLIYSYTYMYCAPTCFRKPKMQFCNSSFLLKFGMFAEMFPRIVLETVQRFFTTLIQATENSLFRKTPTKLSLGLSSFSEATKYFIIRSNRTSSFLTHTKKLLYECTNVETYKRTNVQTYKRTILKII